MKPVASPRNGRKNHLEGLDGDEQDGGQGPAASRAALSLCLSVAQSYQ